MKEEEIKLNDNKPPKPRLPDKIIFISRENNLLRELNLDDKWALLGPNDLFKDINEDGQVLVNKKEGIPELKKLGYKIREVGNTHSVYSVINDYNNKNYNPNHDEIEYIKTGRIWSVVGPSNKFLEAGGCDNAVQVLGRNGKYFNEILERQVRIYHAENREVWSIRR